MRCYWNTYCDESNGCIFVIDASDKDRLDESASELMNILDEDVLEGVPLLILTTKSDVADSFTADEVACSQKISQRLCLSEIVGRKWTIVSTSAKTGEGIVKGFSWLIQHIQQKIKD